MSELTSKQRAARKYYNNNKEKSAATTLACRTRRWAVDPEGERRKEKALNDKWRANNPDKAYWSSRASLLKTKYGMTLEEYDAMYQRQEGLCAICENPPKGGNSSTKNLNIDHCHTTGKVRGLLCNNCNAALGLLKDDPILVERGLTYLLNAEEYV